MFLAAGGLWCKGFWVVPAGFWYTRMPRRRRSLRVYQNLPGNGQETYTPKAPGFQEHLVARPIQEERWCVHPVALVIPLFAGGGFEELSCAQARCAPPEVQTFCYLRVGPEIVDV
jgi:hypothetical protein